jgi:hypothetical protein
MQFSTFSFAFLILSWADPYPFGEGAPIFPYASPLEETNILEMPKIEIYGEIGLRM